VAADLAGLAVVLPAGAGEIAAHHALDRQHLEPPALGGPAVGEGEQVIRGDRARADNRRQQPVSTRPLSGISVGRITSKVEMRSDATRSSRSSSRA
jgi:hypothetical protein